ncbi:TPA: tyrosine-type recombinase/integrase [Morganella morganii]|nr:tyrosine-type recombinase/integrase [Morganella morganii]
MKKRNFTAEFRRESAQLVADQNYTVADAAKVMNDGLSTITWWVKQLRDEQTGKIPKASPITPEQIEIRELKKGKRSRPKRVVALFEPQYVQLMKSYFATMRLKNQSRIWPVQSDNTVRNWLRNAVERAENQGISYVVNPVTCKTFRHSFAMHLIFNGVPMKVIQAYLGHKKSGSTDIYTKIFSLDAMLHFDISFR